MLPAGMPSDAGQCAHRDFHTVLVLGNAHRVAASDPRRERGSDSHAADGIA